MEVGAFWRIFWITPVIIGESAQGGKYCTLNDAPTGDNRSQVITDSSISENRYHRNHPEDLVE